MYDVGFILFMGTISGIVGFFLGMVVEKSTAGFFLGALLGPIGWIIIFLLPREDRPLPPLSPPSTRQQEQPTRDLESDAYRIWLGKTHSISKNDLFEKYECKGKLFATLEEALIYADELEHHRQVNLQRLKASQEANEIKQIRDVGPEGEMTTGLKVLLILLFFGSVIAVLFL